MSKERPMMQLVRPMLLAVCACTIISCNDLPNEVGTELVPGTDTLYTVTSLTASIIADAVTTTGQTPLYNSSNLLYGKTTDSDARLIVEFIKYPRLGAADSFEIVSSELLFIPQPYRYGDTNDLGVSVHGYELKKIWSAQATWDSIWAADGTSDYYSTSDPKVCSFETTTVATDSLLYVPLNTDATKRWFVLGSDSATRDQLFGVVLVPETGTSIRSYLNSKNGFQVMKLRVVYKHADSTTNDTTFLESAVSYFVNTPDASDTNELLVQGAQLHRTSFKIQIDSFPDYAIVLGSSLTISVNITASTIGVYGLDELMNLSYTSADGSKISFATRGNSAGQFVFPNVTTMMQSIRRDGGIGTLVLEPEGDNKYWRMNRLKLFNMLADELHRPILSIVYTIPTVFQ